MIEFDDFLKVDIRVGEIIEALDFPEARVPAYKLKIDIGGMGIKNSSAQIVKNYETKELVGKLVLCVVNLSPKKIGNFTSEVLTLGIKDSSGECVLITPDLNVSIGERVY